MSARENNRWTVIATTSPAPSDHRSRGIDMRTNRAAEWTTKSPIAVHWAFQCINLVGWESIVHDLGWDIETSSGWVVCDSIKALCDVAHAANKIRLGAS